jgi:hypothetical protein
MTDFASSVTSHPNGTEDMFETRIALDPTVKDHIRLDSVSDRILALDEALSEIDATKAAFAGVMLCRAVIEKLLSGYKMNRSALVYRIAARHGINAHEVGEVHTERENGVTVLIVLREGAE